LLVVAIIVVFALGALFSLSPSSDDTSADGKKGILMGVAHVMPLCSVGVEGEVCEDPEEAFTSRGIILRAAEGDSPPQEVFFNEKGYYAVALAPGLYVVDIIRRGVDHTDQLPREISIQSLKNTELNLDIDTKSN